MAVFYWNIPFFILACAIGVVPVLYGTFKQQGWENASAPQPVTSTTLDQPGATSAIIEDPTAPKDADSGSVINQIRSEILLLLERVDLMREEKPSEQALVES
jgi:hypothetical protein